MEFPFFPPETGRTCGAIRKNIEAVAKLEEEFRENRSLADRIADGIASFSGSLLFVVLHVIVYGTWILINLNLIPFVRPFDPYPFMLLSMVVSLEAIFLSTFVLMKQNRMGRRADQRANLDLQINLLAEREMTLVLQMLARISERLEIRPPSQESEEVKELTSETSVEALVTEIKENLPEE